ncbi:MAG: cation-transporting P-type ATPase [Acidimicrobiales bacterium]
MPVPALPRPDVSGALRSSPQSLTSEEAAARLARYGRNELPRTKGASATSTGSSSSCPLAR